MSLELLARRYNERLEKYEKSYQDISEPIVEIVKKKIEEYSDGFLTVNDIWEDVIAKLETNQFYALSAVGGQGSGKSTLGSEFADKAISAGFKFIYAIPEDFLNDIESWVDKILVDPKENNCIMLDDLSYSNDAQSRKNQALFKNLIARIRHRFTKYAEENRTTARVFIIYVTHRLHAAPPMLRNSGTWIFTEMQSADRDDCLEIIGKNKELRERLESIYTFLNEVVFEGAKKGIIKFTLNDKDYSFRWGKQTDPGDGRLMCIYHAGKLEIYNTKIPKTKIRFEDYRYKKDPEVVE